MSHESRLLDLVVEWEERRAAGQAASPEELCRDCPELLEELQTSSGAGRHGRGSGCRASHRPTDTPTARKC